MSWLVSSEHDRSESGSHGFPDRHVVVERNLETGEVVTEIVNGHECVTAYPSSELLVTMSGAPTVDEVDHTNWMTGRQLKRHLKAHPNIGILYRPNMDDEIVVAWPEVSPVQRVSVE